MSKMTVDTALIRELAGLLAEADLTEIEITEAGRSIRVARAPAQITQAVAPAPAPAAMPVAEPPADPRPEAHPGAVASPMVGTVYVAPEPGAAAFVRVGDQVREGQTVLIIEAMKTMNPIPAPRAGRIARILVENGQPVEFAEALLIIE